MLKSMRNCLQVFLLDWRTDKENDNFKKINRMKKFITLMILSALCLGAKAQYQVNNSDFEEGWDDVTYKKITGVEPKHWNSFLTGTGKFQSIACLVSQVVSSSDIRPGSAGSCSVKISDYKVFGTNYAQGNLTTGCIKMGSMRADDAGKSAGSDGNYNFTDTSNDKFNQQFTGLPDAMHVWVKFVSTNSSYKAKATTILHTAGYYQDPAPTNNDCEGKVVAYATKTDISSSSDWQELEIPFEYSITDGTKPSYALVSFSTNSEPGKGTGNDYMIIDDLEYIYYHSLSSCTYDGQPVSFDDNNSASVSALYDESKPLAYEKKGVGAIVEEAYNDVTGVLTITVKGNDYAADNNSVTTYTIQFKKPSDVVSEKSYTETLYVTINGETTEPQDANVLVQTRYDGNFNFVLKNFVLGGSIPVGNINVPSLTKKADGSFSFQGNTSIEAGDLEGVAEDGWLGPELGVVPLDLKGQFVGEDHLRVSIDIDMTTSDLGQFISVHLGYDAASLAVNSAAHYGTFCAPFDVTIPVGVQAFTISGIDKNGILTLEQQNTIPAHTPVIVYSESTTDINAVQFGVATSSTATSKYLTGVYTDTEAPVGSYVLQNQGGRVGFYQVQEGTQPWVRANRAYLTVPASANVKAFYMDDATAIQTVEELLSGKAEIYDLAGRRQQKLQKGINIVGGKKVLVK